MHSPACDKTRVWLDDYFASIEHQPDRFGTLVAVEQVWETLLDLEGHLAGASLGSTADARNYARMMVSRKNKHTPGQLFALQCRTAAELISCLKALRVIFNENLYIEPRNLGTSEVA